jgi:ribose-phosphate pyrophosphokinase
VQVQLPAAADAGGRTPVLLDDIISTGHTLAGAGEALRAAGWARPLCVAVHALVDAAGIDLLHRAGIGRIVSCDTVPHPTNAIPVAGVLADGLHAMLAAA